MMRDDASQTYEGWRRLWLSGSDSNAIAALRFHGLRGALAVAATARNRTRPSLPPAPSAPLDIPITDAVIAEAASQVRSLLRAPSVPVSAARRNRENRHV